MSASATRRYSAALPYGSDWPAVGQRVHTCWRQLAYPVSCPRRTASRGEADEHGSQRRSPSTTRTASSSPSTSTWTCIPSVPAAIPMSPNSWAIRSYLGCRLTRGARLDSGATPTAATSTPAVRAAAIARRRPARSSSAMASRSVDGSVWISSMCWSSSPSSSSSASDRRCGGALVVGPEHAGRDADHLAGPGLDEQQLLLDPDLAHAPILPGPAPRPVRPYDRDAMTTDPADVRIRPMRADDVEAVERLSAQSYFELDQRTCQRRWPDPAPRSARARRRSGAAAPPTCSAPTRAACWVAEADGELVGHGGVVQP